jgi:hypothetical protein
LRSLLTWRRDVRHFRRDAVDLRVLDEVARVGYAGERATRHGQLELAGLRRGTMPPCRVGAHHPGLTVR